MKTKNWHGHLPQETYARIITASPQELAETDDALTPTVANWNGVPTPAHHAALEALILVRLARRGHDFRPRQGRLI